MERLMISDVEIDLAAKLAAKEGMEIRLTPGEWVVLEALIHERGRVMSREDLQERLWDAVTDEGITSRTVDMHISRLRQKLGVQAGDEIVTVRNFGYRLNKD
jgi:DNA-binding response OmpR family regulator